MTPRRLLHITTLLQGGAGRIVADLACAQRRAGHEVAVACAAEGAPGYEHYPQWHAQLAAAGVPVLPLRCTFRRAPQYLLGALDALEASPFVRAGLDLVHAHAAIPALVARTLSPRVAIVATMHGWNADKAPEHAATDVAVFNALPQVVVPSAAAAGHLERAGVARERLLVVPYGLDPQPARGLSPDEATCLATWRAEARLVLVCIGTVGARKRQADLISAIGRPELRDRVACAFLGDGADLDGHARAAGDLGMGHAVRFLGRRDTASDWLRAADVAVFPSEREGLPITLLEAAALGAPLVASDIDEHRAVVADGRSGLLFATGDPADLARALSEICRLNVNERRRFGHEARAIWQRAHRPATMFARYDTLYGAAIGAAMPEAVPACP